MEQDDTQEGEQYAEEQAEYTQDNRPEEYSHEEACYGTGEEQSNETHKPHLAGVTSNTGCDLIADQDSGYVNSDLVHHTEHATDTEITASSGHNQVSEVILEQPTEDDLSSDVLTEQEAVITEHSPENKEQVQPVDDPHNVDLGHTETTICPGESQTDSSHADTNVIVESTSIAAPDTSKSAMHSETNLEGNERTSNDDSSKTDVNEQQQQPPQQHQQQQSNPEETPVVPHSSQGTETIMTEIKLVYTEAPET